jgi:hypothetical protein
LENAGRRSEIDTRLAGWDERLELLRVRLGTAAEGLHEKHGPTFHELYRRKEALRSGWETIRGVYQPEASARQRFEEALVAMEQAWAAAEPMVAEVLGMQPPG